MGDMFPDNYAAKAAYAAYQKSMLGFCQKTINDDWNELERDERDAWVAAAEAAYKAEKHLLSDQ